MGATADEQGFLEDTEPPTPSEVPVNPGRLEHFLTEFNGREAVAKSPIQTAGALRAGSKPDAVEVNGRTISIPPFAKFEPCVEGNRPGILVSSADPKPNGTWVWVEAEAAAHGNQTLRELETL